MVHHVDCLLHQPPCFVHCDPSELRHLQNELLSNKSPAGLTAVRRTADFGHAGGAEGAVHAARYWRGRQRRRYRRGGRHRRGNAALPAAVAAAESASLGSTGHLTPPCKAPVVAWRRQRTARWATPPKQSWGFCAQPCTTRNLTPLRCRLQDQDEHRIHVLQCAGRPSSMFENGLWKA